MLSFVIQIIIYFRMLVIFVQFYLRCLNGLDYQCPTYLPSAYCTIIEIMVGNLVWPDCCQVSL